MFLIRSIYAAYGMAHQNSELEKPMTTSAIKHNNNPSTEGVEIYEWNLVASETGTAVAVPLFPDMTVQVSGTFASGTVAIEGSCDPAAAASFSGLNDVSKTAISFTADGIAAILENTYWIRPVADAVTAVKVVLLAHP
jgi:hypothetical protein